MEDTGLLALVPPDRVLRPAAHRKARPPRDRAAEQLIRALRQPSAYPHPVGAIHLVQTHISWVLLTGEFAYKVKKPVNFGFLDYSTLDRRRQACEEELRLNRRWVPDLYLDVVPIAGPRARASIGAAGAPLEYAVRMRQFAAADQLDRRLAAGLLTADELVEFAEELAAAHGRAPVARDLNGFGSVAAVRTPVAQTLDALCDRVRDPDQAGRLARLRAWVDGHPADDLLRRRLRDGFVREVHGDLHLANLVRLDGRIRAFDCIEFDPALRWIDVMSDVAFMVMDLSYRGRGDLAHAFLSRYLEATGDYAGLALLRYYGVYRALVRAKVAAIRRDAESRGGVAAGELVRRYLDLAEAWTRPAQPRLVLMHGLSGSGKTRLSESLVTALGAVRLRSDLERRRGAAAGARYAAAAIDANYARLEALTGPVLAAGESAIVDATFLARRERERFYALARRLDVPCVVVDCRAARDVLERRLAERGRAGTDASEADAAVLARQVVAVEPLAGEERGMVVKVDTSRDVDAPVVARAVLAV